MQSEFGSEKIEFILVYVEQNEVMLSHQRIFREQLKMTKEGVRTVCSRQTKIMKNYFRIKCVFLM